MSLQITHDDISDEDVLFWDLFKKYLQQGNRSDLGVFGEFDKFKFKARRYRRKSGKIIVD